VKNSKNKAEYTNTIPLKSFLNVRYTTVYIAGEMSVYIENNKVFEKA
jgi:hypothetical protein